MRPNTKLFFFETPSNPTLELVDIAAVSKLAKEIGAIVVVDNVFATPMLQRPLEHGADVVVYSATKHIDGQGRCLGGAVLGSTDYVTNHLQEFLRQTGPSMSPFNAWVMLKGLETHAAARACPVGDGGQARRSPRRPARACAACSTAGAPTIRRPTLAKRQMTGGGQMIAFEVDGGKAGAFAPAERAAASSRFPTTSATPSRLITHPATTTHHRIGPEARAELGIGDGLLRLSVGLEAFEDLAADLDTGLAAVRG